MGGTDAESNAESKLSEDRLELLFRDGRTNALLSWLLVGVLVATLVEGVLDADLQWVAFVAAAGVIVLVPAIAYRDWQVMLPWELVVLAFLPILVRGLFGGQVGTFASYLSVAGLALLVTVELHRFTALAVTHWFAVVFVTMTTMASAAAWSIMRWNFDRYARTSYLSTNEGLMVEFVWVTLAGVAAGVLFDGYFRRRDRLLWRVIRWVMSR